MTQQIAKIASVGKAYTDPISELIFGQPRSFCTRKVMESLKKKTSKKHPLIIQLNPQLEKIVEFVLEWHKGDLRQDQNRTTFAQHPILMAGIAFKNVYNNDIVNACLLKAIVQGRQSLSLDFHALSNLKSQCGFNPNLENILFELSSLPKGTKGEGLEKNEKIRTRKDREDQKISYLNHIGEQALVVELISRIEHLISDLRDIKKTGKEHWNMFTGDSQTEIVFFKKCFGIFKHRLNPQHFPAVPKLLKSYENHVSKIERIYSHS